MSETNDDNIDDRLEELSAQIRELGERGHYRTMMRIAHEARRLARVEQRLMPYLTASFHVMNDSRHLLQPGVGREVAIELITLLESEDRARQFQPSLPEEDYDRTRSWLTACAYDNLAVHTAASNGYNSDGMHQCITDGIQVCRRTGKLECIACFREYATDVYIAADDLDMALHHARVGINNIDPGPHDRRFVGAKDSARILLLSGQVQAAIEQLEQSWELTATYHSRYSGRLDAYTSAMEIFHLAGCPERLEQFPRLLSAEEGEAYSGPEDAVLIEPPRDEFPGHTIDHDLAKSLVACCHQDFEAATALLQPWDVKLREQKCLSKWFEIRLRLIAIARLAGQQPRAEALAKPLREASQKARDWLTLRRLDRLLDTSIAATPLALAGPVGIGPFADQKVTSAPTASAPPEAAAAEANDEVETENEAPSTPLGTAIDEFYSRMMSSDEDVDQLAEILADLLNVTPDSVTDPRDASRLLHVARFISETPDQTGNTWTWSQGVASKFPQDATVLSMHAALAAHLREQAEGELDQVVLDEWLEKQFRQSLDLNPNAADNFARAGTYYLTQENFSEAERCLARGFRLLRTSSHLALRLAEVYRRTDRPRDAVAALDMALREGSDDPDVAWEAALLAHHTEQYEAALTYLDRFDEWQPDAEWSNYYRASALLELDRPGEALLALDREAECNPDLTYHVAVLRASALAMINDAEQFRKALSAMLATPLYEVDYLTASGLQRMFTRLWIAASQCAPPDDPWLIQLETRLLESSLSPNNLFSTHRDRVESVEGDRVNFYRCLIRQPLDEGWATFPGRMANEEIDWPGYIGYWGVLAHDETEARDAVAKWQQRCYPLAAEILEVEEDGTGYTDKPGVVWQGYREVQSSEEND